MIEKICPVHNVPVYGEKCTKEGCTARPIVSTTLYWCDTCKVPVFGDEQTYDKKNKSVKCPVCESECKYIATDMRPVFPEEKLLLEILLGEEVHALDNVSVWNSNSGYFFDGNKRELSIKEINQLPLADIKKIKARYDESVSEINREGFESMIERFVKANSDRYFDITDEAIKYIQDYGENNTLDDMFVSFSGGKDSTVTSDLVTRAFATNKVKHIFGDTTLEFPLTYEYRARFAKTHTVLRAKNYEKNFEQLCEEIGPPSRVMRWCCTVFKTGAITKTLTQVFKDKTNVLTFYGIRKSESASRSKYDRESESPKITKQTVVSPIIDWIDFDVWLYILTTGIDFNDAYKLGYSRVGCWCCPNNGAWSEFLSKVHMYDKYVHWRKILVSFAEKIGKPDAEEYVDSGNWKARQGGQGLEIANTSIIKFEPCATEDNAFNYELQNLITEDLYELFKPFGYINKELGNKRLGEVYVLDRNGNVVLVLQGRIGTNRLKVTIKKTNIAGAQSLAAAEGKIKCQLTKYQMCLGCKACASVCKHNAISVHTIERDDDDEALIYRIDDDKCVRCTECVDHFNAGCYMRKVLTIKRS
ncbi:phosphoadenosine phosphosulfate reductase domain-containing protein [Roseburia sp. 831b]|uniref:phosphoadenosine phosphosulfate reductase domain-containing protein n=1 Tax=Roseburia sp. 831b TaxID=1261635 RepID=UPI0009F9D9EB|nr:phosphoadenosine phosphosulfate reductase family protein [Roseburia sp. 831b]WVK74160.1 phosphoadenosine phosphosulfate reductase family protein [Roseburia sp. 831b]